ncbi:MAG: hypothetical protein PHR24_05840 [Oscillospiraceae bacterium]|nr:hypothetical protein [Oscillospiraceae bacterium]MDD3832377.1 hypothetical protein [Oscillospiraceae bacterium]MDD4546800.1 hypothetical protein [Oscillospiraceae bacterium]
MINNNDNEERDEIMHRKLYGNNVQATCEYCMYGRRSSDGKAILCPKRGVMPLYHHCRKYIYDPLRRIPSVQPVLEKLSKEDFDIDSD